MLLLFFASSVPVYRMILVLYLCTVFIPIDSWQNELLEEVQVRGYSVTNFPSVRPYDIQIVDYPAEGMLWSNIWLPNLSSHLRSDTVDVMRLKPTLFYEWSTGTVFLQPVLKFGDDSLPPSKEFEDVVMADYERVYVRHTSGIFSIFIGRERFAIGPSPRYNLLLSGYSAPLDWLHYSLQSPKLKFSFFISRLDDLYSKPLEYSGDTISQYINARRYLTIKRFDYSPTKWLNFGLSEGAVFGGEDFALEMYHFNPIALFQAYQYNYSEDMNLFLSVDGKVFLSNISFYLSLLIDDFQLEKDPNDEPNHWGTNIGAEFADPFGLKNTFWMVEYTAVSRYTYCHFVPYQRFKYRGTSIGSPFGPDYDEIYTKFIYHIMPRFDAYAQFSYQRKGESNIDAEWPIPENPRVSGTAFPQDNFLSGDLQKSANFGVGFRLFYHSWFMCDAFIGYLHIKDFHHIRDESEGFAVFRLQLNVINL